MPDMDMNLSRVESILEDTLGYDGVNVEQPKSRVEQLLIELREAIEAGGGGSGGTTNYNALVNKPKISGVTLQGDKALSDLGITNYDDSEIRTLIEDKASISIDASDPETLVIA